MEVCECGEPYVIIDGQKFSRHMGGRNHWGAMQKQGKVKPRQPQAPEEKKNESGLRENMSEAEVRTALNAMNDVL